ncbi:hypothetical protein [Nocardia sp. CA-290969]|uniref:hypothetical protein n=1 Tax=Nocardia sp. CA-290969 TaxID=3239986 RepID=UPI003D8F7BE7
MNRKRPARAVVLLHTDHDPAVLDALLDEHHATTVYTVHTDAPAVLSAMIAVQHALEHLADAVVIPHLRMLEPGTPWWVVTQAADLITSTHRYPFGTTPDRAAR